MEAPLRFLSVSASRKRTGDHLLPAVQDAPANRQTECRDFGRR